MSDEALLYIIYLESRMLLSKKCYSGSRIEVNHEYIGKTPLTLKIFGNRDGTFHNFGKFDYTVTA